jgi:peptide/nickel transport system ATP-binding protein
MSEIPDGGASLLSVSALRIFASVGGSPRLIVDGVDLHVDAGEAIGIVGESGSGKSLTARALMNLLPSGVHATGDVDYRGEDVLRLPERRIARMRGSEIALVFQDPFTMLNPLRRCGDHIVELLVDANGRRLSRSARREQAALRLAEVGIHDATVADRYPFQLSGGMRQRVGIAAALARDPTLLIADEPSTALDVTTQREILALLKSLQSSRHMGLVLITHDLRVAFSMCDRIYVLYAGSVLEEATASELEHEPLHPYSLALLLSEPPVERRVGVLPAIGGSVPAPADVRGICNFAPRCKWATGECRASSPELRAVGPGRSSACVRLPTIRAEMSDMRRTLISDGAQHSEAASSVDAPILAIEDLTKVFHVGGGAGVSRNVTAVDGVTLKIGAGESVGLVGESGSGKSTIARCVVGLETPSGGHIALGGIDVQNYEGLSRAERRTVRRAVQMVFQDPYSSLNPMRTVGTTLKEALGVIGEEGRDDAVVDLLRRVGLPAEYAGRKPVALSGGERQRVAIARALAIKPQLLVCDEPVSALDVSVQAQILNLFNALRADSGVAYLFITHDLAVVRQIADRVYVMYRGRVVEEGDVASVLERPSHPYTTKLIESLPRADDTWLESARPPASPLTADATSPQVQQVDA